MKSHLRLMLGGVALASSTALILAGCAPAEDTADGGTTITWWSWDSNPVPEEMIAAFEAENPDITVESEFYNYNDYLNALRPGLTSNDGPDVFQVAPGGMLANYGPLAVDLSSFAEDALGAEWKNEFNTTALEQLQFEGTQVALPTYMTAAGLVYYNSTLVDELGIAVPTTVPEWIATCQTVTAAGYTCLAQGAKDAWVNTDVFLALANSAAPGYVYDAIAGEAEWTSPELQEAMEAWSSLFTSGVVGSGAAAQAQYPDAFNAFLSGEAVFIAMGTWNTPGTQTKTGLAVSQEGIDSEITGVFLSAPFPAATADAEPTRPFGGVANGWAINVNSDKQEAAFELIRFLSAGGGQELIGSVASFPAFNGASASTEDVVDPQQVADIERQQESLTDLVGYREIPYPDLATAIGQALSAVAAGTQTPQAALEAIQAASDGISR